MLHWQAGSGVILVLGAVLAGCTPSDYEEPPMRWHCASDFDNAGCTCDRISEDLMIVTSGEVAQCEGFSCCLYSPDEATTFGTGTCECLESANCEGEASSRPGTSVVPLCPPNGMVAPVQCAEPNENCRYAYLEERELEGCCAGSVCRENTDGIPVCQPATEAETTFSADCRAFARTNSSHALELVTPSLATSVGTISLPPVTSAFLGVGPLGCVNTLDVTLSEGLACRLDLVAAVAGSEIAITSISGELSGCRGYTGGTGALDGFFSISDPQGTMTFTGAACDAHLTFEAYNVAGRFDFELGGGDLNRITIANQHLILEGAISGREPMGECAAW